jgi:hypothetical protein
MTYLNTCDTFCWKFTIFDKMATLFEIGLHFDVQSLEMLQIFKI